VTVGAVLAIEASRLARNGRDWHTLIEFCDGKFLCDQYVEADCEK
jgi:hypothetical protein